MTPQPVRRERSRFRRDSNPGLSGSRSLFLRVAAANHERRGGRTFNFSGVYGKQNLTLANARVLRPHAGAKALPGATFFSSLINPGISTRFKGCRSYSRADPLRYRKFALRFGRDGFRQMSPLASDADHQDRGQSPHSLSRRWNATQTKTRDNVHYPQNIFEIGLGGRHLETSWQQKAVNLVCKAFQR